MSRVVTINSTRRLTLAPPIKDILLITHCPFDVVVAKGRVCDSRGVDCDVIRTANGIPAQGHVPSLSPANDHTLGMTDDGVVQYGDIPHLGNRRMGCGGNTGEA